MKILPWVRPAHSSCLVLAALLCSVSAFGQKPEYDFYRHFRNDFAPKLHAENRSVADEEILERYAAKLKSEGVAANEIARRTRLIRTERDLLESDYWKRFYTNGKSNFNKAPNGFLMQMVKGRPPGVALDYGMGGAETPSIWRSLAGRCGDSTVPMPQSRSLKSARKSLA